MEMSSYLRNINVDRPRNLYAPSLANTLHTSPSMQVKHNLEPSIMDVYESRTKQMER